MSRPTGDPPALAVLTAAGSGSRLGCSGPKALVRVAGETMVRRAAWSLARAGVEGLVITAPPEAREAFAAELADLDVAVRVVSGSTTSRQASVAAGLAALAGAGRAGEVVLAEDSPVLIHDAARCLTPPAVARRVVAAVRSGAVAVVPGLPVTDTLKEVSPAGEPPSSAFVDEDGSLVVGTPDRARLRAVQTPQGFTWNVIRRAHLGASGRAASEATAATDDASLVEALGLPVVVVPGDVRSLKVTTPLDLRLAELLVEDDDVVEDGAAVLTGVALDDPAEHGVANG